VTARHSGARVSANPESNGTLRVPGWIPGSAFGRSGMTMTVGKKRDQQPAARPRLPYFPNTSSAAVINPCVGFLAQKVASSSTRFFMRSKSTSGGSSSLA